MSTYERSRRLRAVLVVEGDPDIQIVVRIALRDLAQLQVQICSTGVEALGVVQWFRPQMIVLGLPLPDLDGPSILARLRALPGFEGTPVLIASTGLSDGELAKLRTLGALGPLTKPFDPLALSPRLHAVWREQVRRSRLVQT